MTLGVRAAVLDANSRVLLVRHGYLPGWHFPGGGVERRETLLDALTRELLEEGNVILRGAPQWQGMFYNPTASVRDHIGFFVVRDFEWKGPPKPSLEIREANFFPVSNLPDGTSAGTLRRLDEIAKRTAPSAVW